MPATVISSGARVAAPMHRTPEIVDQAITAALMFGQCTHVIRLLQSSLDRWSAVHQHEFATLRQNGMDDLLR